MNTFGAGQPGGGIGQGQHNGSQQQGPNQAQTQQLLAQMQMMAAAQQQQQQQQQSSQSQNGAVNGAMSAPQIPAQQLQQLQQNPVQMLQVITSQIANLQRQWQTVQAQPDSQQKNDAAQQLATQMKRMKVFHAHTMQALQKQQQQQGQSTQSPSQAPPSQTQQPQQQQQQGTTPISAPTPGPQPGSTPQASGSSGPAGGVAGEAASPAHNAQLAALQAFAQQQRMQALHQPPSQQQTPQQQQNVPQGSTTQGQQQRADLVTAVRTFMASRGTPLPPNMPTAFVGPAKGVAPGTSSGETKSIEMQNLFGTVIQFGGSARIAAQPNGWAIVASQLGLAVAPLPQNHQAGQGEVDNNGIPLPSFVAPRLAQFFRERFGAFEEFWMAKMRGQLGPQSQQQQQGDQNTSSSSTNENNAAAAGAIGQMNGNIIQGDGSNTNQAQSSVIPQTAQEAIRKAQELQAQLPQQLQQLQEMMKTGKLGQQQAKERYIQLQNAAKMAMLQAQTQIQAAQAQAQATAATSSQSGADQQNQSQSPAFPTNSQSNPATTSAPQAPTPAATSVPDQSPSNADSKKPPKRPRKSSTKQTSMNDVKAAASSASTEPTVEGSNQIQNVGATTQPSISQPSTEATVTGGSTQEIQQQIQAANLQAQQALRMLHQGLSNPAQQVSAFAAIRTAQIRQKNGALIESEVTSVSQALAQVYARVLTQAQAAGQPLHVAAPVAFSAAQQEANKLPLIKPQQQGIQNGGIDIAGTSSNGISSSDSKANVSAIPPPTPVKPGKYKVEYMPVRRDVSSYGGWDLDQVDSQLGPILAGRGRFPRSLRELGFVDIEGLTMSIRSRLEVEITYALNALFILTAGVQAPGFNLLLGLCEDLFDELLDLLEESAFGRLSYDDEEDESRGTEQDHSQGESIELISMPKRPLTHAEWVIGVLEDESENKLHIQRKRKVSNKRGRVIDIGEQDNINEMAVMASDDDLIMMTTNAEFQLNGASTPNGIVEKSINEGEDDEYQDVPSTYYSQRARERSMERQADIATVLIKIFLNVAVVPENHAFLNNEPRLYGLLMTIVAALDHEEIARRKEHSIKDADSHPVANGFSEGREVEEQEHSTVFTASEALRLRKEILGIIAALAGETSNLTNLDATTLASMFDFLSSFVFDASEIEQQHGLVFREMPMHPPTRGTPQNPNPPPPPMVMQPFTRKVPQHADLALEALSSLGQPDVNRKLLGEMIEEDKLVGLGDALIKLLPVSDMDFHMLKTEARLAFCERIAMTLFDVAYMGSGSVKRRLKHLPGTKGVVFRCIKRLMKIHSDFSQNPFSVLTRRLVETLRLLSDGENMFNRPPLLGFGMEGSSTLSKGSNATNKKRQTVNGGGGDESFTNLRNDGNLLVEEEESVVELMTVEGIDPTIISELEKML